MHKDNIVKLLTMLGAKNIRFTNSGWVSCSCIFSPWKHAGGTDKNPSFGISINDNGKSGCHCYTCGSKGDLFDLFMELRLLNEESCYYDVNFKQLLQLIADEECEDEFTLDIPDYEDIPKKQHLAPITPFSEQWLLSFFPAGDHPYLQSRGVPAWVSKALDLRFDSSEQRIMFPIRTFEGILAGAQGRAIHKDNPLRYKLYSYKGVYNKEVWGNEQGLDLTKPLVITEGFFDLASIYEVYQNVACSFTSELNYFKYKRLQDVDSIITFFDFGTGGNHARELTEQFWKHSAITHIIPHQEVGDAGNLPPQDIEELLTSSGVEV